MYINRPELKRQARDLIRQSKPNVLYASLIFVLLSAVFGYLSAQLTGVSYEDLSRYMRYLEEGSANYAMSALASFRPSPAAQLIDTAIQVVQLFLGVGFTVFLFNTVRRLGAVFGNLLDGFGPYIRVVLLQLVIDIFVALWSLLFFIPGIIAFYRYSMAVFIMLDHPDYSIMQCIRASKEMTNGYKGKLFALDLSFIGYLLLAMVPYLGYAVRVWYLPYREISYLLFYDTLRKKNQSYDSFSVNI